MWRDDMVIRALQFKARRIVDVISLAAQRRALVEEFHLAEEACATTLEEIA